MENEYINSNCDAFLLSSVEEFSKKISNCETLSDVINSSLKLFKKLPDTVAVSIFLSNNNKFDFEHRATLPFDETQKMLDLFNELWDNDTIGRFLGENKIHTGLHNSSNYLILPLYSKYSPLGLILIATNKFIDELSATVNGLLTVTSFLITSTIENKFFIRSLEKSNLELEQKIATRTSDLQKSQRILNSILQSVHSAILVCDAESLEIIKCNPVAGDLLGISTDDLIGTKVSAYFDKVSDNIEDYTERRFDEINFSSELIISDKPRLPVVRNFSFLKLGDINYRIENFLDISHRVKAEEALKNANELLELKVKERTVDLQLMVHKLKEEISIRENAEKEIRRMLDREKELSKLKSRFVTMVSHEFKTPLTVIKSATQMMLKFAQTLDETERHLYMKRIVKTVDLMTDLIENVIFIGKTGSLNAINTNSKDIKLYDFCMDIIDNFSLSYNFERRINFAYNSEVEYYNTNANALQLIITNLLSNALKYSEAPKPVDFNIYEENGFLMFSIQDYGIGIPEKEQVQIFDLFYRADNVGSISGTGLGMSVVLESIKQLNGKIELKSKINQGSTFIVKLQLN